MYIIDFYSTSTLYMFHQNQAKNNTSVSSHSSQRVACLNFDRGTAIKSCLGADCCGLINVAALQVKFNIFFFSCGFDFKPADLCFFQAAWKRTETLFG